MSRTIACVIAELDESLPEQEVERLLSALDVFSVRVEDVAPGVACVKLDGLEPMYGCERVMLDTLHFALAEWRPRTGVGPSKFLAARPSSNSDTSLD